MLELTVEDEEDIELALALLLRTYTVDTTVSPADKAPDSLILLPSDNKEALDSKVALDSLFLTEFALVTEFDTKLADALLTSPPNTTVELSETMEAEASLKD